MSAPTIHLQVDEPFATLVPETRLHKAVQTTLQHFAIAAGELTVVITTDEAVRTLNYQFRGIDAPTDVLSFAEPDEPTDGFVGSEHNQPYLGDVVIAYPTAESQAKAQGHTPLEEVLLLAIHGTLHLLGRDHGSPTERARMWAEQAAILAKQGLAHVQPTEGE